MAINFPDSPTAGDTFTASDKTWVYVDGKWALKPAEIPLSITVTSAASGDILKWNGSAWVNDSALLAAKANLASPTFTGTPTLPTGTIATTQSAADSTTKVATTSFVTTADNLKANLASPTFTGTPTLPTGTIAVTQNAQSNTTAIATTAFVQDLISTFQVAPSESVLDGGSPTTLQFYVLGAVDAGILV